MNRAGNSQNLAALDLVTVDTTQQGADVVASLSVLQALAEHLEAGDGGGQLLFLQANDFHLIANVGSTTLDTTSGDGARPEMVMTSSMGIRKGLSAARSGVGM